jgi:serine/threonine protein kinase
MGLEKGARLGPYEIVGLLGAGGMGEVYRARDTRLGRDVAIKVLPPELTSDPERLRRFEQEARAAAALNHPNILALYDVGTHDGAPYLVTELLEGESLRESLDAGALPVRKAAEIAVQIAQGLAAAHEKGIIHRDLKPANVFLTKDGHVKILDFGLAKLVPVRGPAESATATTAVDATAAGMVVGTIGYMSPEQLRGLPVDHRSDIFSLGCVIYEMISGRSPFRRETAADTMSAILKSEPPALEGSEPGAVPALEHVVRRCLEKEAHRRFSAASDLAFALAEAAVGSHRRADSPEKSIVVLPFENISPDPEQDYFCDGMTEELISDLSKIHSLRVISRTSSMMLKGTKKDIPAIARDVHVRYVLEGSVRKAGNNFRITAQLIDAASDTHLWAEKYGGALDDVFDIQEKVSHSIVDALKLTLTPQETERLAERPIPSPLAYEFYLKARQEILKWTEAGLENALKYLQSGLEIVGENALLYAGMAHVYFQYYNLGLKEEEYGRKLTEEYVQKAFALDPDCPNANFVRGNLIAWSQPKEGNKCFKRVLDKNPNDFDALFYYSCFLGTLGRTREVVPLEERTIKIDPLNPMAYIHSGFNRLWEGQYELALERMEKFHRSFPEDVMTKWIYGLSLAYMGRRNEAGQIFDDVARDQPGTLFACLGLAFKCAFEGKKSETLAMLDSNPSLRKSWDFQSAYWKTECLALAGEKELALDCLERDVDLGMSNYPFISELDPFLADIRGEERFKKLMERVKYEWEHLEV